MTKSRGTGALWAHIAVALALAFAFVWNVQQPALASSSASIANPGGAGARLLPTTHRASAAVNKGSHVSSATLPPALSSAQLRSLKRLETSLPAKTTRRVSHQVLACIPQLPNYPNGFTSNDQCIQANGSATVPATSGPLQVTPGGVGDEAGSAFFTRPVDLTHSFSTSFKADIAGNGDGLAFVVQNDSRGTSALGCFGGNLGLGGPYSGTTSCSSNFINNSVAVELDPWSNNGNSNGGDGLDPACDGTSPDHWAPNSVVNAGTNTGGQHVGIDVSGDLTNYNYPVACFNVTQAADTVWVDYDASTHTMKVYIVSGGSTKPSTPLLTYPVNLTSAVGSTGYMGFTAGTGFATATQSVENWSVTSNLVTNGSFEQPAFAFDQFNQTLGNGSVPGWTECGSASGMEVGNAWLGTAEDGNQYTELNSDTAGAICQTISTVQGQSYQLSFYYSPRPGYSALDNVMDVQWGGTDITPTQISADGTGLTNTSWVKHSYVLTAASSTITIQFTDTGAASDGGCACGSLLDNVQVTQASPGPSFTSGENGSYTWGGTSANPFDVTGTAQPNDAVTLYAGSGCTGGSVVSAKADGSGNWSMPVSGITSGGSYTFSANEASPATGVSACSATLTINVDRTAPTSHVTFPAVGTSAPYLNSSGWTAGCGTASTNDICGTASDTGGSGIQAVYVAIQNSSNQFFNGTTFGSSSTWLRATGTTNWTLPVPLPPDGVYTVAAAAIDNAGNTEQTFASSIAGMCSPSGAGGQLSINGGQLSVNGGLCPVSLTTPSGPFSGQLSINGGQLSVNGGQLSVNGGQLSVNGGVTITGGTCTLTDPSGNTGTYTLTGGTISGGGGQLSINGGQLSVNGGQLSINGGQLSVNGGQLSVNGGGLALDGGICTGVTTSDGGSSGQLSINGGQLSVNGGQLSINGGQLSVNGGQLSVNGGLFSLNGGQLSVNGGVGSDAGNLVVDTVAPYVSTFNIDNQSASGAANIDPGAHLTVNFDESMLGSTLTSTNITVTTTNGSTFSGSMSADPTGLIETISGFQPSTTYTITVSGATDLARNPIGTNGGANPNTFTFTTAAMAPYAVSDTRGNDDDHDTIPNGWDGTTTPTFSLGGVSTNTAAWGFSAEHKDLCLVENYMSGTAANGNTYDQHITKAANQAIVNAFANAPVTNPDGTTGIHVVIFEGPNYSAGLPSGYTGPYFGGQIGMIDPLGNASGGAYNWGANAGGSSAPKGSQSFQSIRAQNFVHTGLSQFCHYAVIAHTLGGTGASGASRGIGSSDFVVALGGTIVGAGVGTQAEQQGTVMHELGHNLGLHHGGGPGITDLDVNYKPDYMSVMNYFYQFTGVPGGFTTNGLDYSHGTISTGLNESSLTDAAGLGSGSLLSSGAVFGTRYFCPGSSTASIIANASLPINWGCNSSGPQPSGSTHASDINADGVLGTLHDYNDWANISFNGGDIGEGAVPPAPLTTTVDISSDNGGEDSAPTIEQSLATFNWTGFFAPINSDNTGKVVNSGKAGRTYPIKFQLKDSTGNYVSTLSAVRSITYSNSTACASGSTDSIEYSTTSSSGLHYDSTANQFVYNWATPSAPGCYMLNVNLADGTTDLSLFSLQ